jgi:uncharacterized coiled-coil protein SlyX
MPGRLANHTPMSDVTPIEEQGQRIEAIETKLAFLERTVDDLDVVVRELHQRADQLVQSFGELRHSLERLLEALAETREPAPPT